MATNRNLKKFLQTNKKNTTQQKKDNQLQWALHKRGNPNGR